MAERPEVADHYGAHYRAFAADVYGEVRRAAFGEDIGQNSWLTIDELDRFLSLLEVRAGTRLLDVGCGSGGPTLHVARRMGCEVVGVELSEEAVAEATRLAHEAGPETRACFLQADAGEPLPFEDDTFDALICIDAINHIPDRARVLDDWARVLRSGGRLLFTDPVVITGILDSEELAIRTSIGYFLFVPPGENERLLAAAGLTVVDVEDTTDHLTEIASRRHDARAARAEPLRKIEGDASFEGRQRFFDIVATLAHDRRLSRFAHTAEKQTSCGRVTGRGRACPRWCFPQCSLRIWVRIGLHGLKCPRNLSQDPAIFSPRTRELSSPWIQAVSCAARDSRRRRRPPLKGGARSREQQAGLQALSRDCRS